ncbi:MAG: NAD(P)/FAD-dependent oxidoreductase [Desulfitobacteriaceae bacterium]
MRYVIAGNGPAGIAAVAKIREFDRTGNIILIAAEGEFPYSRIMVPEYMAGEVREDDLTIRQPEYFKDLAVEMRSGLRVEAVRPEDQVVILDNREVLKYDRLLLATGSRPVIPSWRTDMKGVFSLWNKADAEIIRTYLPRVRKIVVAGGGLVGLQAAAALNRRGLDVVLIEKMDRLMPGRLDEPASYLLQQAMEQYGVRVLLGEGVQSLLHKDNRVQGVALDHGTLNADMVIMALGVRPNFEMLANTAIAQKQGILVNEFLQTSDPNIFAAGDVAQGKDPLTGAPVVRALWLNAVQQGKVAGANMTDHWVTFAGSHNINSSELFGLPIVSQGEVFLDTGLEETVVKPAVSGTYRKILTRNGRLAGFLFVGDIRQAGVLYHKLGQPLGSGYWSRLDLNELEMMA